MENVLFLQSEVKDPYEVYARMRIEHPLYFDRANNIWAFYRYDDCESVLKNTTAYIPQPKTLTTESEEVRTIIQHLARLSNPPYHESARKATLDLMSKWKRPEISDLIHYLIGEPKKPVVIDWVNEVARKLPALALLKGFGFSVSEIDLILIEMETLVKLMLPVRTDKQNLEMNKSVSNILNSINLSVTKLFGLKEDTEIHMYISNLIGLLIQSYDAGRGLLSNALIQLNLDKSGNNSDFDFFKHIVNETVRFNSPVHNTRRVLTEKTIIQNRLIDEGSQVLIVLASANRDSKQFSDPDRFDVYRNQTPYYLSFGAGAHQCMAEHFSSYLTASALHYLYNKYDRIKLTETEITYEPRVNVRLPVRIRMELS